MNRENITRELRGIGGATLLIAIAVGLVSLLVMETGITHASSIFLIPVVAAATRWGVISAVYAAIAGVLASAFFFYEPVYSFRITNPHEFINLTLFIFVAVAVGQLATRLKRQAEVARQREIDMRDLYAFSRRLAMAFDVGDIHAAIEDHLATVMQRKVILFSSARDAASSSGHRAGVAVPELVLSEAAQVASGRRDVASAGTLKSDVGETWLVRAVSPKNLEFGVIAVNLGRAAQAAVDEMRTRVDAVLADATATLERLGVSHAIGEARMRAQTEQLREALIGSVSHELRTPLASILGAATVLGASPALANEGKLKALVHDVRDEAERLNNDIQNLLDASRISSNGITPHLEWADPADIVNSAIDRCKRRLAERRVVFDLQRDLPLIHVDPVLVQQALVQLFDNAVKYSPADSRIAVAALARDGRMFLSVSDEGAGLTPTEHKNMWDRFVRGERHAATTNGSGLGLWIANAFVAVNGGKMNAVSEGPDRGTTLTIELPVTQAAIQQLESDADE